MNNQSDVSELLEADAAGDADAATALARHYSQSGEHEEAVAAYKRAIDRGANEALVDLGLYLWEVIGQVAAGEECLRIADERGLVNGSGNLGRLLRDKGDLIGAEAAFRRAYEHGSIRALGDYAFLAVSNGSLSSEEVTQLVVDVCSAQDSFWLNNNTDAISAAMALDSIEEQLDSAAVNAGFFRADEAGSAVGAWNVAWVHHANGNTAEMISSLRRSIDRGHKRPYPFLAGAYMQMGDRATAKSIALEGDQLGVAESSTMYGMILDEDGDLNGAIAAFRRGDEGGDGNGSLALGQCLCQIGEFREAVDVLRRAVERGAEGAEPALQLAQGSVGAG
ncbi:MAG: hypothetical protein ACPHCI_02060 [Solirubrobacterales bacterium]